MASRGKYRTKSKEIDADKLQALMLGGASMAQISAYFDVSIPTIFRRLKDTHSSVKQAVIGYKQAALLKAFGG